MTDTLYDTYKNFSYEDINLEFIKSCKEGNLEVVKFLLTTKNLPFNADISADRNQGLINSCLYNHLDVMQFLLKSPLLLIHADVHVSNEIIFKTACLYERNEQIIFLINEIQLPQSMEIVEYFKRWPNSYAEKLFLQRDLHVELSPSLANNKKLSKI